MKKIVALFLVLIILSGVFAFMPFIRGQAEDPIPTPLPTPELSNEQGYMIYDTFEGISDFNQSGWNALTVEEGNYSSATAVYTDEKTPGIGNYIYGVRTVGGGTGGGMYRVFPRMFQVLFTIPMEIEETPAPLPNGAVLTVEYDIKFANETDVNKIMAQLRAPFYAGDSTPLTSLLYQRNHRDSHLVFGTTDKVTNSYAHPDVIQEKKWYRIRQELKVRDDSGLYGTWFDFYVNGVKTAENQKYQSTSGSKVGVLSTALFSTSSMKSMLDGSGFPGISIDNFTVYIGSSSDMTVNKGLLITALRDGKEIVETAKENMGDGPGYCESDSVLALSNAFENALLVYNDYSSTQAAVDAALDNFNSALAGLIYIPIPVGKSRLVYEIDRALGIYNEMDASIQANEGRYSQETLEAYGALIEQAKIVYNNPDASLTDVKIAVANLFIAFSEISIPKNDWWFNDSIILNPNPYGKAGANLVRFDAARFDIYPETDNLKILIKGVEAKYTYYNGKYSFVALVDEEVYVRDIEVVVGTPARLLYGDVNGDGELTSTDMNLLKGALADNRARADNFEYLASDVNGDGEITSTDMNLLKGFLAGNLSEFPVYNM